MKPMIAIALMVLPVTAFAARDVQVQMVSLQKGLYEEVQCEMADEKSDNYLFCVTDCDVSYPLVTGIEHQANERALNRKWQQKAQEMSCEGAKVAIEVGEKTPSELSHGYSVTFNDGTLLGLTQDHYWYGAGAAHGMYSTNGIIIDSKWGKELGTGDILDITKLDALNVYLNEQISKDDRTFENLRDQTGDAMPVYISDSKREFTLVLDNEKGLYALFGVYQVGPYAAGEIDYVIPREFIRQPHILKILDDAELRDAQR